MDSHSKPFPQTLSTPVRRFSIHFETLERFYCECMTAELLTPEIVLQVMCTSPMYVSWTGHLW